MNSRLSGIAPSCKARKIPAIPAVAWLAPLATLALVVIFVSASPVHAQAAGGGEAQIDGGQWFTCAVASEGALHCWGSNSYGRAPATVDGSFVQVSGGFRHACAVETDGTIDCWGSNTIEQCNTVTGLCEDVDVGQARPPAGAAKQVSAGAYHTCRLLPSGYVDCWGFNGPAGREDGRATDRGGPFTQVTSGAAHNCAIRQNDGSAECWGYNLYGQTHAPAGVAFTQLSAGENHTCGLQPNGNVACWGGNTWGQAPKARTGPYTQIAAGDLFTCGLKAGGLVECWGYNFYGQRNAPAGIWTAFGLGDAHGCATNTQTGVWQCWGRNNQGQAIPPMPAGTPVTFDFEGFYPPLAPDASDLPALNLVKAGSAVPLKFSLGGNQGLNVIETGYPESGLLACSTLEPSEDWQATKSAGEGGLTYDPQHDQYTYVWKTEKAWAGSCRVLALNLVDGTEHLAAFRFR